jgi:hypothetical protein
MATTTDITSTYSGEAAAGYIAAALLEGNTIAKGGIEVLQNIKYKQVMQKLAAGGNIITSGSCDFTPSGDITITERVLEPKEFQVNLEFCTQKWLDSWDAISMGYSAYNTPPKDFTAYIMGHVAKMVNESTELAIWQGDGADGAITGFTNLFLNDPDVARPQGESVIEAYNVQDKLGATLSALDPKLFGLDDLHLYVSQDVALKYVQSLGGQGTGTNGFLNKNAMWYGGEALTYANTKVFTANGLPRNTIIAAQKSNLFFGTGLLNDSNSARLIDMAPTTGSQNFRVIMRYTAGVQYGIGAEVAMHFNQGGDGPM